MTTSEIRSAYLNFFKSKGHTVVQSSSLVPDNDPSLLFTNAGMNQFKDVYLGKEKRGYTIATTAQKCVRAGGKHNDLENVGYTARHHTFFEMLGNFSFGDYFKHDAIHWAWELLTEVFKLPPEKLTVTVYKDDDEAYGIWHDEVGIPAERIIRIGDNKGGKYESDNFWTMGDTGPCGPCSEIFYDHGPSVQGGPPGSPDEDGDRFMEIWNLVFTQFNRQKDGTMTKLPHPNIDTGMGLERMAAVLQGVHSNYDIDLFRELIKDTAAVVHYDKDLTNKSLRVIADHIRSCSFLIADGVAPSNEGRGYVLRRIIRRAVRHGRKLGMEDTFFYKLVPSLVRLMGDAYPELVSQEKIIEKVLKTEEEQFSRTLDRGLSLLESSLKTLGDSKVLPGDLVFKLYDTYGFPADLTADVVRDRGYTIDTDAFDREMAKQKARAKEASNFAVDYNKKGLIAKSASEFTGYDTLKNEAKVIQVFNSADQSVESLASGEDGVIILDRTPFYGEKGGQVGDTGTVTAGDLKFEVRNSVILSGIATGLVGHLEGGSLKVGDTVTAEVDAARRADIEANHSGTHLLQYALQKVLGKDVAQKGSYVDGERLRFDFSHTEAVKPEELAEVERLVNEAIRADVQVQTKEMPLEEAKKSGAMALFGEKYGDVVRVVSMGDYSSELCGGTHEKSTGRIGYFRILSESGISAGVRRIEAVTGRAAVESVIETDRTVKAACAALKSDAAGLAEHAEQAEKRISDLEREIRRLKEELAADMAGKLMDRIVEINGRKVIVARVDGVDGAGLRTMCDDLRNRLQSGIVVLGSAEDGKVSLIAAVTKDLTGTVKAGELVNVPAGLVGGKGGGKPELARAGGSRPENLDHALSQVAPWLEERL